MIEGQVEQRSRSVSFKSRLGIPAGFQSLLDSRKAARSAAGSVAGPPFSPGRGSSNYHPRAAHAESAARAPAGRKGWAGDRSGRRSGRLPAIEQRLEAWLVSPAAI